jgi:hypothetical protein
MQNRLLYVVGGKVAPDDDTKTSALSQYGIMWMATFHGQMPPCW